MGGANKRARDNSRAASMVMAAFVVGVLFAALIIPKHATGSPATRLGAFGGSRTGTAAGTSANAAVASHGSTPSAGATSAVVGASGGSSSGGSGAVPTAFNTPPPEGNGGATATGVTDTSITIGVLGGNSEALSPACPRCGQGGPATDQGVLNGLLATWRQEGKLPIYGRDFTPVFQSAGVLDPTASTSACQALIAENPFASLTGAGVGGATDCLAQRYHTLVVDSAGGRQHSELVQNYPYMWEGGPSVETVQLNEADWADQLGLLKGQVIGIYEPGPSAALSYAANAPDDTKATLIAELERLGYAIKVDYQWSGSGQSDDPIAVQQMKSNGVTVVLTFADLTEPSGFQNQAEQLGYRPKYVVPEIGAAFTDAVAGVNYNTNAQDGNYMFGVTWRSWAARSPATPSDNPVAAECLSAYEKQTGVPLDVYNDDAKITYILDECTDLELIRQAIVNAGPNLTQDTFNAGMVQISAMQTSEYWSVTFGASRREGDDTWQSALFNKNHWQPSNGYIEKTGPYQPFWGFSDWTGG